MILENILTCQFCAAKLDAEFYDGHTKYSPSGIAIMCPACYIQHGAGANTHYKKIGRYWLKVDEAGNSMEDIAKKLRKIKREMIKEGTWKPDANKSK